DVYKRQVGVVLKDNEGNAEATKTKDEQQKTIGKLLGKKDDGTEAHAAASASIGAVSGVDILKAISKSSNISGEIEIEKAKNAAEIATAKKEDTKELTAVQKDAVIACLLYTS
ncbi:variable large family protein, partial [Pseudomonas aeruginosa]|nr:variable large family protein [Pseudomonas aeruginosa]